MLVLFILFDIQFSLNVLNNQLIELVDFNFYLIKSAV